MTQRSEASSSRQRCNRVWSALLGEGLRYSYSLTIQQDLLSQLPREFIESSEKLFLCGSTITVESDILASEFHGKRIVN